MENRKTKILIIDDEESIRESMALHLSELGYEVTATSEPELCTVFGHGNCTAEQRCADIIFIDQNMPGMTGADFIRKQSERGCKLPPRYKMIMTGAVTERIQEIAAALGCEVTQKPFSLKDAETFVLRAKATAK